MDDISLLQNKEYVSRLLEIEDEFEISKVDEFISIQEDIIIPISSHDYWMDHSVNIEIKDYSGSIIGIICTQTFSSREINIKNSPDETVKCFLVDADDINEVDVENYRFTSKYLLIHKSKYSEYKEKYMYSSALWGGYCHLSNPSSYSKTITTVTAVEGVHIPTAINNLSLQRSTGSNNCFEKFLSLYHQFELIFDLVFVKKIKKMNDNELYDISKIVKRHAGATSELDLLKNIIEEFCTNHTDIEKIINEINVSEHTMTMKEIFQDFTKTGNPFADQEKKFNEVVGLIDIGGLTHERYKQLAKDKDIDAYRRWMIKIISYWLYRLRCSIAHNRISEFVFNDTHEKFVDDIGIQLLRKILILTFKSNGFKQIMV